MYLQVLSKIKVLLYSRMARETDGLRVKLPPDLCGWCVYRNCFLEGLQVWNYFLQRCHFTRSMKRTLPRSPKHLTASLTVNVD